MKLKRIVSLCVVFGCLVTGGANAQSQLDDTLQKIKKYKVIAVGHRESSIPFSYYAQHQKVVGYAHDIEMKIVDAVKQELKLDKLNVKMMPITSQNRIALLQNRTIDFECGSTTHNLERQKQANFSNSFFIVGTRLLTRKDSGIQDFPDLKGKIVVTTAGTTSERILRTMNAKKKMGMSVISAKDHSDAFLMLETKRAQAWMMDDVLLAGDRAKAKKPQDFVIVGTPQSYEVYGCMLRKNNPEFKRIMDATIAQLQKSGEAEALYKKWFESPIPPLGINLNFPMIDQLRALFENPNDQVMN